MGIVNGSGGQAVGIGLGLGGLGLVMAGNGLSVGWEGTYAFGKRLAFVVVGGKVRIASGGSWMEKGEEVVRGIEVAVRSMLKNTCAWTSKENLKGQSIVVIMGEMYDSKLCRIKGGGVLSEREILTLYVKDIIRKKKLTTKQENPNIEVRPTLSGISSMA